ncbi:MAG: B12-binding domain-containing radical SAM protein [Anaerolineae bacterium]|nr:B12-binding domain-containing radical SAM protein [Anaerolineae bacterium]
MVDLLLVNPLFLKDDPVESGLMTPYFPLGILYVAAAAREAGYDVAIFDGMFASGDHDFAAALEMHRPKVVGFGVLATVRQAAFRLATIAKSSGALVVMGGADPTSRPITYLNHQVADRHVVDVVTVGESEETMLALLAALRDGWTPEQLAGIQGIAYRDGAGAPTETGRRPLIRDVDAIPFPARDLVDYAPYREAWRRHHGHFAMSIIATRGCPFSCAWCQKAVFGRSFRPRSPESVAEEMRHIKVVHKPDFLRIVDDAMGIDKAWVRKWHDEVLAKDAVIPFECLSRVDLVDEEVIRLLKAVGCRRIAFGAESGSQKVLDAMTKGIKVEQIHRAARICRDAGIETYFYMMVGYPGETWDDIQASVSLLRQTRPDDFSTTIAYPLPGTAFFEQVRDQLPDAALDMPDWDYTAENRLLFQRGAYSTAFYRRVIRWFHHEWEDARLRSGFSAPGASRLRTTVALWRDRVLVRMLELFSRAGA